jgi:hypothetical protein
VLIVSEETGLISVATQGKIYRGLDQAALREMLLEELGESGESLRSPMRRMTVLRPLSRVQEMRTMRRRG